MSWGTGYQKGIKLGYQSPEEKAREKMAWESTKYKLQDDRLTVATSNGGDR
jgi:membrane-bound inhibitor of C-type lysozyme